MVCIQVCTVNCSHDFIQCRLVYSQHNINHRNVMYYTTCHSLAGQTTCWSRRHACLTHQNNNTAIKPRTLESKTISLNSESSHFKFAVHILCCLQSAGGHQPFPVHFNYMATRSTPWSVSVQTQSIIAVYDLLAFMLTISLKKCLCLTFSHWQRAWCSLVIVLAPCSIILALPAC